MFADGDKPGMTSIGFARKSCIVGSQWRKDGVAPRKTTKMSPSPTAAFRLVESQADVEEAIAALTRQCALMRQIHDLAGVPAVRRNPPGFLGLSRIVVFQQVSTASGNAIWARVQAGIAPFDAATVSGLSDDVLRGFGLSRPKVRTLRALSDLVAAGRLDLDGLHAKPDADIRARLVALHGIGPWTADIFLMFNLGRADVMASGDLALQEAAKMLLGLETRPDARQLAEIAERWRPWRSVAALMLWNYYRVAKQTQGGAPV